MIEKSFFDWLAEDINPFFAIIVFFCIVAIALLGIAILGIVTHGWGLVVLPFVVVGLAWYTWKKSAK